MQNIVKTMMEIGGFKNFIRVIQKTGFNQNLSNDGQFTVFAPDDNAFNKNSSEKIENLLNDKDRLITVLKSHIINKKIDYFNLKTTKKIKSINGKELIINTKNGLKINDSNLIKSDIDCTNGIIHIIDNVLFFK